MSDTTPRPDDGVGPAVDGGGPPAPTRPQLVPPGLAPLDDPWRLPGAPRPTGPGELSPQQPPAASHPIAPPPVYGAPVPAYGYGYGYGQPPVAPAYGADGGYGVAAGYRVPPGYGVPPAYGDPYAPAPKTNGLAIASLVVGLAGIFCGIGIVGVVLGIVALHQIRQGRGTGKGLAVGGIVAGAVSTLLIGAGIALAVASGDLNSGGSSSSDASVPSDYRLPQTYVAGDCFSVWASSWDMSDADAIDCAQPHGMEVVTTFTLSAAVTSTDDRVLTRAQDACWTTVSALVPKSVLDSLDSDVFFPSADQWGSGARTAYCVVVPYTADTLDGGSVVAGTYGGTGTL